MHKIKVSDEVNFIFRINETVLLNIDINLATKRSHVNYHVDEDELRPILNKNEWSYNGIENRLNWWFNQDKSLAHYAMSIYKDGFFYSGQVNLRIDVEPINYDWVEVPDDSDQK